MGLGFFFSIRKRYRRLKEESMPAEKQSGNGHSKNIQANGNPKGNGKHRRIKKEEHVKTL